MKPPRTLNDLNQLIANRVQENLHLDYKASQAIADAKKNEIAKDVSAFSNSDGGLLIYGVREEQHLPIAIDNGVDHDRYSREWLEQVILSNISPTIHGLEIVQIPITELHSVYVVSIPKSIKAPHQERGSKRYYKRYNFKSAPMEDYEISDVRNRRHLIPPLINVDIVFEHGTLVYIEIKNIGDVPAFEVKTNLPENMVWRGERGYPPFFQRPVKYFPLGKKFSFMYNTFQTIIADESILSEFKIDVEYLHSLTDRIYSDSFYFNLSDNLYSRYEENETYKLGVVIKSSIKELTTKVDRLGQYVNELTRIVDPSGLSLSYTALKNLRSLKESDGELQRLDPRSCDYKVFKELLGTDDALASRLEDFFSCNWDRKSLSEIEGVDEEIIERIKARFDVKDV